MTAVQLAEKAARALKLFVELDQDLDHGAGVPFVTAMVELHVAVGEVLVDAEIDRRRYDTAPDIMAELAVIRKDAAHYKGIPVDLPEPVAAHIDALVAEIGRNRVALDALRVPALVATPESPWTRVDDPWHPFGGRL